MPRAFGDWRVMWIDPLDSNRLIFGSDGGVNISYDRGKTSHHAYNLPLTEWYAVGVDMEDPYNIYGGLQDHDSWKGPVERLGRRYHPDRLGHGRGGRRHVQLRRSDATRAGSTTTASSARCGATTRRRASRPIITPRRPADKPRLRFNWTPPIALSPHNPAIVYTGAQVVFRSLDRGDHWQEISPDLTTNEDAKQHGEGNITYCTITTLAESPVAPGVIWTGSDDGKVQVTKDGGATWLDRTAKIAAAGGPANFWVTRVHPSPHAAGTAFVTKTGWRLDDYRVSIHKTTDYGETWTSIAGDLPAGKPLNVVIQDRKNPDLLFVGTEWGVYVTLDGGKAWWPFRAGMPSVKVTDLVIHPRENDLVVATYGRGAYVVDITPLQEMTAAVLDEDVHLFEIEPRDAEDHRRPRQLSAPRRQPSLHAQRAERDHRPLLSQSEDRQPHQDHGGRPSAARSWPSSRGRARRGSTP